MKKNVIISIVLIVLVAFGWMMQFSGISSSNSAYAESLEQATKYQDEGLYQKSIEQYEEALAIKDSIELRDQWLDAYRLGYDDGVATAKEYGNAILAACDKYPEQIKYWERLLEFYLETTNYNSAYDALNDLERSGATSEKLTDLVNDVRYSYKPARKIFYQVYSSTSGAFTVYDGEQWGVMGADGETLYECDYLFVSPVSSDGSAIYKNEKDTRLINEDNIVDAIIAEDVTAAHAPSDYLLPVADASGKWRHLDCSTGKYLPGVYEAASSFTNGIAAVKSGSAWTLITVDGESACESTFGDVKLHPNGEYVYRKIMIAAVGGDYAIYNASGELHKDIPGVDADIYLGGYIAYQDTNGKWGYVDKNGQIVIEPQFAKARSFSNGLAAVYDGTAWGYINTNGMIVIDCQYLDAGYFSSKGVAFVSSVEDQYNRITLRFGG